MKFAVVAGGWHWPWHFYQVLALQAKGVDLYVVSHRDPELPIVREEKAEDLKNAPGRLGEIDRMMYSEKTTKDGLQKIGWNYSESPNTCGDQCFLNQWLEKHDFTQYDAILNCHDDTYIRRVGLFDEAAARMKGTWLILANGYNSVEPEAYFRGSFEFWSREMIELLGGRIDIGELQLTREGKTDSPRDRETLQTWNDTGLPVRNFLTDNILTSRVAHLSYFYRVSSWAIEGERGFISRQASAPEWSLAPGLEAYPL
jgi:hypothetical protein